MNTPPDRSHQTSSPAEETLRMLAKAPAPDGLSARVQASLRTAPRRSGIFSFGGVLGPSAWMHSAVLRTAAAAGIVCVVAGGGWQIYSHVQTSAGTQGAAVPIRVNPAATNEGGFSTSGAIAKPDPLKPPVITHQPPKLNTPEAANALDTKKADKKRAKPNVPPAKLDAPKVDNR